MWEFLIYLSISICTDLYHIRSASQYSLVQGLQLFYSFMRRSHLLPDQLPGEYTGNMAAVSMFLLQHYNLGKYIMFLHSPYCTYNPTIWLKYGGWACSDGPHTFFYMHQSHRYDSTYPAFLWVRKYSHHPDFHHVSSRWCQHLGHGKIRTRNAQFQKRTP